ncbi:hypothetical protein GcM1_230077 [Golovinomyces cichoracearum]|uniref:Uncharacterized protein n=1 Tax=Golovinomyces cichoracearum TaxID=62708 RepID=A0A420INA2_9PEZI|nr:hypothetical protein GcM1_230077 [Golovinomyces cichoracearum]
MDRSAPSPTVNEFRPNTNQVGPSGPPPNMPLPPLPSGARPGGSRIAVLLPQSVRNLPSRTRLLVGVAFLAWGTMGLYLTEPVEKKLGLEPCAEEKEKLGQFFPRIEVVEKKQ